MTDADFDALWNQLTSSADYADGESANTAFNWGDYIDRAFEVDTSYLLPGQEGYGWRYFSDGTAIAPTGEYYYGGEKVYDPSDPGTLTSLLTEAARQLPGQAFNALKSAIFKPDGSFNPAGVGTLAAAAYGLLGGGNQVQTGGYNVPVPKMTMVRDQVEYTDPNRRPGAAGREYFTSPQYVGQSDAEGIAAARTSAQSQAQGIMSGYTPASPSVPTAPAAPAPWERAPSTFRQTAPQAAGPVALPEVPRPEQLTPQGGIAMAGGGQVPQFKGPLQSGGFVVPGDVVRHADPAGGARKEAGLQALHQTMGAQAIRGPGDAMSDSIPTSIDGKRPAAVANGEAYVPPEKVAEIGGGSMKRGSERLYEMMDRLRMERTGSKKQINPDNPQELARAYRGGAVAKFSAGGATGTGTPTTTPVGYGSSQASTLSPWAGEYVTTALGQGAAAADAPFQAYKGPLTAGPSALQQQAFAGAQGIANAGFTPTQFSGGVFGTAEAQQYMNPYLQAALDPQLRETKRQADIARLEDAARLTKAGAYGGSRQAIMESEGRRNLLDQQSKILGEGYRTAFDRAADLYGADRQARMQADQETERSRQFSADFGLKSLADVANLGKVQRDIEAEGIAADKAAFEEQRDRPLQMAQYKLDLLGGIPVAGSTTTPNMTGLGSLQAQVADLLGLYGTLGGK